MSTNEAEYLESEKGKEKLVDSRGFIYNESKG